MNPFEQNQPHDASEAYRPSSQAQRSSPPTSQPDGPSPASSAAHSSRLPPPFLGANYPSYAQGSSSSSSAGSHQQPPSPHHHPLPPLPASHNLPPISSSQQQRGGVSFQVPPPRMQQQRNPPSRESLKQGLLGGSDKFSPGELPASRGVPELLSGGGGGGGAVGTNTLDPESGFSSSNNFKRKKSLVRPDRERMDPNHRQWYYRNHAAQLDMVDASGRPAHHIGYMPSTTGHLPQHGAAFPGYGINHLQGPGGGISGLGMVQPPEGARPNNLPPGGLGRVPPPSGAGLRRGKSILGREEDQVETGINFLKRGVSLRRTKSQVSGPRKELPRDWAAAGQEKPGRMANIAPGPVGPWMIYCYALTICCVGPCLGIFGIRTPEQQRAWREKIGLLSIIITAMAGVGFITFGFTQAVCDTAQTRYEVSSIDVGSMVFYGFDYDFNTFFHPQVPPFSAGGPWERLNPVYSEPFSSGRQDGSLIAQRTGGSCTGLILDRQSGAEATQFFPCQLLYLNGTSGYRNTTMCHSNSVATAMLEGQAGVRKGGPVYYTWEQISDPTRNFIVWKGAVLDANRLNLMWRNNLTYPAIFDTLRVRSDAWSGRDVTASVFRSQQDTIFDCLDQIARVGFVDSETIGCVASKVELYVALVVILGVVGIKFIMAVIFGWFLSWRLGNYGNESREQRKKRAAEIEDWSDNIYRPAPASYRPNVRKHRSFLPTTSRFSTAANLAKSMPPRGSFPEKAGNGSSGNRSPAGRGGKVGVASPVGGSPPGSPSLRGVRSSTSLVQAANNPDRVVSSYGPGSRRSSFSQDPMVGAMGACPWPLDNVVPQPPPDYMPFQFPLAYSICLVTAYSESFEGLRTTLDSLATTDYPNSHKVILVIADGIVKGAGSELSTPDICLSMMKDFITPPEEVEGNSYVAIADGFKRHNMAKVYAGFYEYDDETVERSKQQRIPMVLVAKCGSPLEAEGPKPGNRGKRDSQVLLMAFLQKVMFDERMTAFEYDFFNALWRVTGVSPDHYEIILMVDADTKVFPDSLTRMVACMVEDPDIMGLCGETKIANKSETWVTMIQVFEYYISHHQTKAFESCFGGVTCLPGCFSAYRIKAPKGAAGYWVPILANPDIVEHYSENVVDTLHKKNLLLLGEDRFLTTLMLKTFPKRKMMFVPQAVCKTVVPDTFRVLLSQRRRWINSTVHNLAELVMVNDLCGTFCFSMRFVVFMELAGTLVLPAAIAFTLYVVVSAIVAAIKNEPVQSIPLILLALILGLPGILIIVTSRKIAYVGWMGVYLLSLPIWNFVLPTYAFWHMDDFSWGATRIVQGDAKGGHGDAEGKFDPSNIVMKRWIEFERDRRLAAGIQSRDSTYDVLQIGSPERVAGSSRYSFVSSSMTGHSEGGPNAGQTERLLSSLGSHAAAMESESGHGRVPSGGIPGARARMDAVPLLSLPAPLGDPSGATKGVPPAQGSFFVARPARDTSPASAASSSRPHYEAFSSVMDEEHQPMITHVSQSSRRSSPDQDHRRPLQDFPSRAEFAAHLSSDPDDVSPSSYVAPAMPSALSGNGAVRPRENAPRDLAPQGPPSSYSGPPSSYHGPPSSQSSHQRGFSLVDDGPAGIAPRVVQRGARRTSTADNGGPGSGLGAGSRFSRSTADHSNAGFGNGPPSASSAGGNQSTNPFHR